MRLLFAMKWDLKFLARYGFYLLYGFLTVLYVVILFSLPQSWKENAAAILIFSDPAAMGLFFMGAIVLLEKSQRVTSYFAVSPLRALEYVGSKVFSLNLISLLVAAVLAISAGCERIAITLFGTFLSGVIFTLLGILIATKITSLNQFILATVPVEVLVFVPAVLHLFESRTRVSGVSAGVASGLPGVASVLPGAISGLPGEVSGLARVINGLSEIYPPNVCMDLVAGRGCSLMGLIFTLALAALLFYAACRCVSNMWTKEGGIKL